MFCCEGWVILIIVLQDPRYITIEAIIGGGEFGDVCRGKLTQQERQDML